MKSVFFPLFFIMISESVLSQTFTVVADQTINGSFTINPPLPSDGKVAAGTVLTVTAAPDKGFVLDAGYYSVPGMWGQMYHESMASPFRVKVDADKHIGVSFIRKSEVDHVKVTQNVVYAKPGVKTLKYDVYSPKGAKNLPCIIIIHGGGWASNDEDIMRGLARELTRGGKFVVFSIDYRWARKLDGDNVNNTMADIIGDVYGAIAHIMEHAADYGGDPTKIGLTGDSAGGHLSAAASLMVNSIGDMGFGKTPGVFEFMPSYMPANKTVSQLKDEMRSAIKAAAPSYGVFGGTLLNHYSEDKAADDSWKNAIAPINYIPAAKERQVPHYLTRGMNDVLIKDADVKTFADALSKAGQRVQYVQIGGAGHAFFDWKPDEKVKQTFYQFGVYYAAEMKAFFLSMFRLNTIIVYLTFLSGISQAQDYRPDTIVRNPVFVWPEGKHVAVSLTFDDARLSQTDRGIPLLDKYCVRATFYISPGNLLERIDAWKKAVAAGHEIGNHSFIHPCSGNFDWSRGNALEDYSLEKMAAELDSAGRFIRTVMGVDAVSFAYPCGQTYVGKGTGTMSYVPLVASMFATGRGWLGEAPNDPVFCNMAQLTAIELDGKSFEQVKSIIESARTSGKWVIFAGHEMSNGGNQTTLLSTIEELCRYASDPANGIWIDNVNNIASYIKLKNR